MKFIETTSSFRYNGEPVTRIKLACPTPFGIFKVAEAVSGKIFVTHPFISKSIGLVGYDPDPDNEFNPAPRLQVASFDEGIEMCKKKWAQVMEVCNSITIAA